MQQYAATKTGKLIQHWPHLPDRSEPQVCVGNDYTEDDLWFDLARLTLGDGGVLIVGLYSGDTRHHVIKDRLKQSGDVDLSRVVYPHIDPIVRKITVQAREAYRGGLENVETGEIAWCDVPAQSAGLVTKTFDKRFHLGSRRNLQLLITAVKERSTVASILHSYSGSAERGGARGAGSATSRTCSHVDYGAKH